MLVFAHACVCVFDLQTGQHTEEERQRVMEYIWRKTSTFQSGFPTVI